MNVTDLLHFQAALQADGIIKSTSDEKHILRISLFGGKPLDPLLVIQDFLDFFRKGLKLCDQILITLLGNEPTHPGKLDGQAITSDQLGAVCLGGSNCDFRTVKGIEHIICLTGNGASYHIDDTKRFQPLFLRQPKGCQAVCGLTGLADHHHQTMGIQKHPAVTELRRAGDLLPPPKMEFVLTSMWSF